MNTDLINKINSKKEIKSLPPDKLDELCSELREFLIEKVTRSGGHLASNLGVVELTVAIHRVFNIPEDKLIFDVGHQAYVHKILTGRAEAFDSLRTPGGLSGFTTIKEGDDFGAGHSSTSVSAALGFAEANKIRGKSAHTVCVIGDGAYTGGMVHEALNNCKEDLPLVIILNENGMSISDNKGTFASYLSGVRASEGYNRLKNSTTNFLNKIPLLGKGMIKLLGWIKGCVKRVFYDTNYFEELGLYYIGPIDGHNIKKLEKALNEAKRLEKCVVVHVKTQKGRGFEPAEKFPDEYHSVSLSEKTSSFHAEAADSLLKLAERDKSIVGVTAAMGLGTGLDRFEEAHPDRYFDVGIAEEHALTFSGGLCAAGLKPYVAIYSTFLQRGYDNIIHDIALQSLPVRILIDRAGLAPSDGATHHGIFDVAFLSHIPNMQIISPATYGSLRAAIDYSLNATSPIAIRYPNCTECADVVSAFYNDGDYQSFGIRCDFDRTSPPSLIFISYGHTVCAPLRAKAMLAERGITDVGVILVEKIKPYADVCAELEQIIKSARHVIYVEEGIRNGGAAMITVDTLKDLGHDFEKCTFEIAAIDDDFVIPGEPCNIYDYAGISGSALADKMSLAAEAL